MQEYWVNVYEIDSNRFYGKWQKEPTKFESWIGIYPLYRIHVKMKPVKIQMYEDAKFLNIHEKWLEL